MQPPISSKEKTVPHGLNTFAQDAHQGAALRGETEGRDRDYYLALCQREIADAQRHRADGFPPGYIYSGPDTCPSGVPFSLANCVLYILVYCVQEGIDMEKTLTDKNHYDQRHHESMRQESDRKNHV